MKRLLIGAVLLIVPAYAVSAPTFETGGTLLDACNAPNLSHHWYCLGYVASISDLHVERGQVCLPVGATKDDLKRVVTNYLETNPVTLNEPASDGVLYALVQSFPCE